MAREHSTQLSRDFLKQIKGTVCINCREDKQDEINYHHVIPLSVGGNDIYSNIVPLCDKCHSLIHFGESKNNTLSHSELIKIGIKKAKKEGKAVGRPVVTAKTIPQSFLDYYPLIKNKTKNITQAAKELHLSRTTIYKYINLIEN